MEANAILERLMFWSGMQNDEELAELLGTEKATIANWRKTNSIDLDIIISKTDDVDLNWLIRGETYETTLESLDEEYYDPGIHEGGNWKDVYIAYVRIDHDDDQPLQGVVIKAKAKMIHEYPFLTYNEFQYNGLSRYAPTSVDEYYTEIGPEEQTCIVKPDYESAVKDIFVKIRMFTIAQKSMSWMDLLESTVDDEITPDIFYVDEFGDETRLSTEEVESLLNLDEKKLLRLYQDPEETTAMWEHILNPEEARELAREMTGGHITHDEDNSELRKEPKQNFS